MNIIELLEQLSNDIVADAFTAISRAHIMSKEAIWPSIMKELPPDEQAEALGLESTVLGAGKDALARKYVSRASKSKASSLDLRSLFSGIAGS